MIPAYLFKSEDSDDKKKRLQRNDELKKENFFFRIIEKKRKMEKDCKLKRKKCLHKMPRPEKL